MKVKKEKPNVKNNKGFTLIEVLLAIVILSLVSAPILRGFIVTANTSARARKIMEATDVAQLIVEQVSATTYEDDVKSTFLTASATPENRLPAIGYNAKCENMSGVDDSSDQLAFLVNVRNASTDQKICYHGTKSSYGDVVALPNVEYDGKTYDVLIHFTPNSDGTKYFTYNVRVLVFDQDSTTAEDGSVSYSHFRNKLVELDTEISNKY